MGSPAEKTHGRAVPGGPSEATDCGTGWARQQLVDSTRQRLAEQMVLHLCTHKLRGTTGEQNKCTAQGSSTGK